MSYSAWRAAMIANATANPGNTYAVAAAASLPENDPIGNGEMVVNTANARALGLTANTAVDSTLTFSNAAVFEYDGVATSGAADFLDVAAHELDEGLGIGSALTGLLNNASVPPGDYAAEDYFRYSAASTRDITTSPSAIVYFSYDGGNTNLAQFNQAYSAQGDSDLDRNDWVYGDYGCPAATAHVQDAIICDGQVVPVGIGPEITVLNALGYDSSPQATVVSATPNSGSGSSQTFALEYSDTAGAGSLQTVWVYFSSTLANPASNSCLLYYNVAANLINLAQNSGTGWVSATPGAATTLQNSQCSLNVAATTATLNGNTLTLTLPMTFLPAYAGAEEHLPVRSRYIGLQQWLAAAGHLDRAGRCWHPGGGFGDAKFGTVASQSFALQYSDTAGAGSLQTVWVYFSSTLANPASNSCLLYYNVAANLINLAQNSGTAWVSATPGAATTLQNSQCSLNVAATTATLNGNTLTLNLPMTFLPAYAGAKNIYLYAADISGSNSGWQQPGTWTVPAGSGTPAAVSVTPNSGTVASQSFALQYSDTAGAGSLQTVWVYFSSTLANPASNSCLLYYNVAANLINLAQNSGTAWVSATPGAATTLQNSQCSLNVAATTATLNGNTLTLTLPMTFLPAYAGAKNIYMYAADLSGSNSGWQQPGSWTVPASSARRRRFR